MKTVLIWEIKQLNDQIPLPSQIEEKQRRQN